MQLGRRAGGPETYEASLLPELVDLAPESSFTIYCLSAQAAAAAPGGRPHVRTRVLRPRSRWLSIPLSLPWRSWRDGIDLLHATFIPPPVSPVPYVFTMHDVSMFEHPEFYPSAIRFRLTRLIERGLRRARVVLCISEHCRRSVLERFDLDPERLLVAHHGVSPRFQPVADAAERAAVLKRLGVEPPYLLHVGKYEPRKNLPRLLDAFARVASGSGAGVSLVLAGKPVWRDPSVAHAIARLGLAKRVVELGHVADEDLPALYTEALAFVFPTLWEGFGLPILEAMACGAPVVASSTTSLPEVAGDAALLVDPESVEALAAALERILDEPALRDALRQRGAARAAAFSWRRSAEATLAAYRTALGVQR
jgi:glycosyltransferase involved in cell wall biosynthesis